VGERPGVDMGQHMVWCVRGGAGQETGREGKDKTSCVENWASLFPTCNCCFIFALSPGGVGWRGRGAVAVDEGMHLSKLGEGTPGVSHYLASFYPTRAAASLQP